VPLSDDEIAAWRRHPDTFFGVPGQRPEPLKGPLEMYDFLLSSMRFTPREKLLEAMKDAPDFDLLKALDQPTLASIRAERMTYGFLNITGSAKQI
jgi:hypothetical protein